MSEKPQVAVCGCGAAGSTLAAYLTCKGFKVNLYEHPDFAEKGLKPFQERGGIEVRGAVFNGFFTPNIMTTDIQEALDGVDIAMLTVPAYGHEKFAKTIIPNLQSGQIFLNWTSYWFCIRFSQMFKEKAPEDAILSEGRIYPFATRRLEPALIYTDALKAELMVAALPSKNTGVVLKLLQKLFLQAVAAANVLQTTLECYNVQATPAPTFLNVSWWEKTHGDIAFNEDLMTPGVGRVLEGQDKEKMAIGKALGLDLVPGLEITKRLYAHMGARGNTINEVERNTESAKVWRPRHELDDPTCLLAEDIPYGLAPLSSLGRMLGVPTPTIDALLHIASLVTRTDFWKIGLTVEKLGLAGMNAKQIVNYATEGR